MSRISKASLVGVVALVPLSGLAQNRPNFSGDWVLVSATTSGASRGEATPSPAAGERPTQSNTASGAAFNCGRECSIVHKGATLAIDKALLASRTEAALAVTVQLDGRERPVPDSFNPGREIPAMATWSGGTLVITSKTGSITMTQRLSLVAAQLVVVTDDSVSESRVTYKYKKE